MRESISAQSCASVPPAPALMPRMQFLRSCGPFRKTFNSSVSRFLKNFATSRSSSCSTFNWRGGRLGLAKFEHHAEILQMFLRLKQRLDLVAEGIGLVNQRLRLFAVVPEKWSAAMSELSSPGASARRARQRNLRRCVSLSDAVVIFRFKPFSNMARK